MNPNVGGADRIIRIILGLGLIGWGVATQNWWGAIGVVLLATALAGWCPVYLPLGINTAKRQ